MSAEIGTKITGGTVTTVRLREAGGGTVKVKVRADGTAWVPAKPLKTNKRYEAEVTAADGAGKPQSASTSLTTMGPAVAYHGHRPVPVRRQHVRRREAGGWWSSSRV